jgi:hypothetical protein
MPAQGLPPQRQTQENESKSTPKDSWSIRQRQLNQTKPERDYRNLRANAMLPFPLAL